MQISIKTGVVQAIASSLLDLRENNREEQQGTASTCSSGGLRQLRALMLNSILGVC
jgi:hypothetical protein